MMHNNTRQRQKRNSGKRMLTRFGKRAILSGILALIFLACNLIIRIIALPGGWEVASGVATIVQTLITIAEAALKTHGKKWHDLPGLVKASIAKMFFTRRQDASDTMLPTPDDRAEVYLSILYHSHDSRLARIFEVCLNQVGCKPNIISWDEGDSINLIRRAAEVSRHVLFVISESFFNQLKRNPVWLEKMEELAATPLPGEEQAVGMTVIVDGYALEDSQTQRLNGFSLPSTTRNDIRKFFSVVYPRWQYASAGQTADEILDEIMNIIDSKHPSGSLPQNASGASIWMVPKTENLYYQVHKNDAGDLRQQILDRFSNAKASKLPQIIWGPNGVGKTELAMAYAHRYGDSNVHTSRTYRHVLWADASKYNTFDQICDILFDPISRQIPTLGPPDVNQKKETIKQWFEINDRWLLVLDGYNPNSTLEELQSILPRSPKGDIKCDVLLTMHQRPVGIQNAVSVALKPMSDEEGATLLLNLWKREKLDQNAWKQKSESDWATALKIVREMGGLPLGIQAAARYLRSPVLIQDYLNDYKKHSVALFKRLPGEPENDEYDRLLRAFTVSFKTVSQDAHRAGEILQLLALLSADAIPHDILDAGFSEQPNHLREALNLLYDLSFIEIDKCESCPDGTKMYKVNKLVHAMVRAGHYPDPKEPVHIDEQWQRVSQGAALLHRVDIFAQRDVSIYLPHIRESCRLIMSFGRNSVDAVKWFLKAGHYLNSFYQYKMEAKRLLDNGFQMDTALQASLPTPTDLNSRAELYQEHLEFDEAEKWYLQALESFKSQGEAMKIEGTGNGEARETRNATSRTVDKATILQNLACLYSEYSEPKRHEEATQRIEEALALREEQLDAANQNHRGQMLSLEQRAALLNSALCHDDAGIVFMREGKDAKEYDRRTLNYEKAEEHFQEALKILKNLNGEGAPVEPEHQARCKTNLATLYTLWGRTRYRKARKHFQATSGLAEQVPSSSPHNALTENDLWLEAIRHNNLAVLYRKRGKKDEARQQYNAVMALYGNLQEKTLKWQLMMLGVLYNYIVFLREAGDAEIDINAQKEKFREIKRKLMVDDSNQSDADHR